ncbi:hypothetical protein [Lacipirellula limnantheis]|uniref:PEP-CTERM protein-sorting domain-containing protein n=1 Tax=Lacipirellula limnantheis TaxID=2528024 RepID=A0A517TYC4_9BACT|nr:hypothetical protein [Lacipirellula limnantheis]QDT73378.1 hypothetical protein I41_25670 [Lacipirellula limnantheis]
MNKHLARYLLGLFFVLGLATQALGSLQNGGTLSFGDIHYLGRVNLKTSPSNAPTEVSFINELITLPANSGDPLEDDYDRVSSFLPGPFDEADDADDFRGGENVFNISLAGAFQYLYAKYDGKNYGALVWYFPDGITGNVIVPQFDPDSKKYEISHLSAYNPVDGAVPEPATIAVWGMLALAGAFGAKKWWKVT